MKSLAIKYRPATFDDVVEQREIKSILHSQIETGTHKNCYLFTGGAGTGKTTCARIFANELNKGAGMPIEVDAASNNGVDNVREIISESKFKALDSEFKIYIIDECHMLSIGAWNAMLKLIEEPPAKTIFIFCTTDPQKIPATILSRVQRYDFKRISHRSIINRLAYILDSEISEKAIIRYDVAALDYIAKIADGGMRDAITLLDKCLSFQPEITVPNIITALGISDYDQLIELTEFVVSGDVSNSIQLLGKVYADGADMKQFIKQYLSFLLDAYKFNLLRNFDHIRIPSTYKDRLAAWDAYSYSIIRILLDQIIQLNSEIKWESNPRPLIEATFIIFIESLEKE